LALPAAIFGYSSADIEYSATVGVEVLAAPDFSIYNEFRTSNERIFEYIRRQESEIGGQRVLELAVNHPDLRAVDWPTGIPGQQALKQSIRVEYGNRSTNFTVRAVTGELSTATAAITAITSAYRDIHRERNSPEELERQLEADIRQLDTQIAQFNASIEAATAEFGTSDLEPLIAERRLRRRSLEDQIDAIEETLAFQQDDGAVSDDLDPDELDVEDLAQQDGELARLIAARDNLQAELDILSEQFGSRHNEIKTRQQAIQSLERQITDRVALLRDRGTGLGVPVVPGGLTGPELERRLERAERLVADADAELRRLTQTAKDIERDQIELNRAQELREDLANRRSKLDIERENIQRGRINIAPIAPASVFDDKRKPFALAGFMLGGMTGVGLVVAYGLFRRTFRYVEDIDDPGRYPPLLGTLPELDRKDPDAERIAAVSVHNLRNTLHTISRYGDGDCQVIVCTSAEPGDGKTTLIQSLGASYALTGLRTIIVDLDLVGGGLSARLGMSGRRGVADLLGGLEPTKCIKRTATEKLYALPAGDASACKPEQLAHRPVQQVVDWLRERFDVVLMDTGPVLGSLEAGLAVGLADQVLLVTPRGQAERLAQASITRLRRLGATNIGLVFNRADTTDLKQSLSAASIGAPSLRQTQRKITERRLDQDASIVGSIPPPMESDPQPRRRAAEDGTGP
ncbi:MAG: AAA family ATPase, partial [Planctomycetota bacterium]